jgi:hypothetical protein
MRARKDGGNSIEHPLNSGKKHGNDRNRVIRNRVDKSNRPARSNAAGCCVDYMQQCRQFSHAHKRVFWTGQRILYLLQLLPVV